MTTMFALLLALLAVAQVPAAAQDAPPPPVVPSDWSTMPPLPWRSAPSLSPDLTAFVAGEVRAGRCVSLRPVIDVELAVYVRIDGTIRAVVPRAINCPTIEQFAAGLVTSFGRNNLRQPAAGWYRATITFDWGK